MFIAFVTVAQGINRIFYGIFNKLFTQGVGFFALFVFPLRQILSRIFNFGLYGVKIVNQRLFLFFGQFVKSLGAQNFAVFNRCNDQSDRHMQQGNAFAFGLLLQDFDIFFFLLFIFFADDAQSGLVFIAIQNGRNRRGEFLYQFINVFGKLDSDTGRKTDGDRFVRLLKVINISPVIRGRTIFGFFAQNSFDKAGFAGALRSEAEQVIPFRLDVYAQLNRAQRPVLSQRRKTFLQLGRG